MVERLHAAVGLLLFHATIVLRLHLLTAIHALQLAVMVLTRLLNRMVVLFHAVMVNDVMRIAARQVMADMRHEVFVVGVLYLFPTVHL